MQITNLIFVHMFRRLPENEMKSTQGTETYVQRNILIGTSVTFYIEFFGSLKVKNLSHI